MSSSFPLPAGLVPTPRIVGGAEAGPHAFPFVLSLRSYSSHICGAGLVAPMWAITAAHCLTDGAAASRYSVNVHRHDIGVSALYDHRCSETVEAAALHTHPQFVKSTLHGDVALIQLVRAPRCASEIPMLVLDTGSASTPNTMATIAGWGHTDRETALAPPNRLQVIQLPLVAQSSCVSALTHALGYTLTAGMICAGHMPGGVKDSCQGDSGGPLFIAAPPSPPSMPQASPVLVGIVSWGHGCANVNAPGVYTRISYFRNWCNGILNLSPPPPPSPPSPQAAHPTTYL